MTPTAHLVADLACRQPCCAAGVLDFSQRIPTEQWSRRRSGEAGEQLARSTLIEITYDRRCPDWRAYKPGVGPGREWEFMFWEAAERRHQEDLRQARREARILWGLATIATIIIGVASLRPPAAPTPTESPRPSTPGR